jgi:hypothetical protein
MYNLKKKNTRIKNTKSKNGLSSFKRGYKYIGREKSGFTSLPWSTETAIATPSLTSSTKEIPCMSLIQDT